MKKEIFEDLIEREYSSYFIAKKLGISQTTVRYYLKKFNLSTKLAKFRKKEMFGDNAICKKHGLTKHNKDRKCLKCGVEYVNNRRVALKLMSVEYKGGCCSVCGYNKCADALDFHHLDPTLKSFSISTNGHTRSWDVLKKELDKCVLLCANCHREEHSKMFELP